MRTIAIIPTKGNSRRVPEKNFRLFEGGMSLLEIKVRQCLASNVFDAVYVSSDSEKGRLIAEKFGANFLHRPTRLCLDETPWSEVLTGVLQQLPEDDETLVAWCPPTSPLFSRYDEAVQQLSDQSEHDSLMTVTRFQHYFLGPDMLPLNFQFGVWASFSQKLRPLYQMNCALWLASKKSMLINRFQTGDNPYFMETSMIEGTDIDTMEEFELAQLLYTARNSPVAKKGI
ncbi:acylneuraminate cytidylyltransferase family protein [Oxalicibacterium flavum]|nr:capsular biosynthesis protein [Oxalicibacterium flavum]